MIAEVDNTGNSTLSHLHLQVNLSTDANRINPEDWEWSENTSRNPELWLEAFNNSGVQTTSAVGKLTDVNGNPVGGKLIWGMEKPLAAEGDPAHNFLTAQTYAYTWANADDLVVENFGTTDVQAGTYHLYARNPDGALYEDLGTVPRSLWAAIGQVRCGFSPTSHWSPWRRRSRAGSGWPVTTVSTGS